MACQLCNGGVTDGTLGHIDNSSHGKIICGIDQGAQIGQNILDLLTVIEFKASIHPIADAGFHKRFLHHTRLRVRPVKHRKAGHILPRSVQRPNLLADPCRLLAFIFCAVKTDQFAGPLLCPQGFVFPVFIMGNHLIGRIQDIGGGSVILFQLDHRGVWKILFKVQDVADIRTAPAVDRLIVIAHHAQVLALLREQPHKHILRIIGILILIYMDITDFSLICFQHRRMQGQKLQRFNNQVVKIQRVGAFQLFFIGVIDFIHHLAAVIARTLCKPVLRAKQFVLRIGYLALDFARRQELFIDVLPLEDFLDGAHLIIVIIDGKRARISQLFNVPPQNPGASGMKRGNPHIRRMCAGQALNSLAHFCGRFVCKRDGHDRPRRHAMLDQVGHAVCQGPRFAGTRAGKHQKRPFKRFRREPLFSVEVV